MKTPVITAKKVSTFQGHDGIGVNADIYIGGVYVGHFYDDARGGEPEFDLAYDMRDPQVRDTAKAKFAELETYAKAQPEVDLNADKHFGDKPMMHKQTAMDLMDDAINKVLAEKDKKQQEKKMLKGIMYGNPKHGNYRMVSWKGYDLPRLIARPDGLAVIQSALATIKRDLKAGEEILNAEALKKLGVKL